MDRAHIFSEAFIAGMAFAEQLVRYQHGVGTDPDPANYIRMYIDGRATQNGLTARQHADKFAAGLSNSTEN